MNLELSPPLAPAELLLLFAHSVPLLSIETLFLSHADRGRAQDDVGLMGETDVRSSAERGAVN